MPKKSRARWPACDICQETIDRPREGVLSVDVPEADRLARFSEQDQQPSVDEPLSLLRRSHWDWTHERCMVDLPDASRYLIYGDEIKTAKDALSWTLHLMRKTWFSGTDWGATMSRLHQVAPA